MKKVLDALRGVRGLLVAGCCAVILMLGGCGTQSHENIDQGMALIEQQDYEAALTSFDAALLDKEDSRLSYRGAGIAYLGLTEYEQAAEYLERALSYSDARLDEVDYDINYYLATAYYKMGDLDSAKEIYSAILALRPKEKNACYLRGVIEIEEGDTNSAQEDFDLAVEIDPTDYDMRINIFISCLNSGEEELGEGYLQAVLESEDELSDYNLGRMYYYLGDYSTARTALESAKDTASGVEVISMLGQTYEQLGDYNYAASVYSNYLASSPDAQLYNQLGLCEMTIGDYEAALAAFQAGLALEGDSLTQTLKFNEIVAYEYLGDFDQALVLMRSYLAAYPDDEAAEREYEFLQTR